MICYRDRTYCPFTECENFGAGCSRNLTDEVQEAADDFGLPVCTYTEPPECFVSGPEAA